MGELETTKVLLTHEHYERWAEVLLCVAGEEERHKRTAGEQLALRDMATYFVDKGRRARVLAGARPPA